MPLLVKHKLGRRRSYALKNMEGGGDSNPVVQIENLSSCHLDDLPIPYNNRNPSEKKRVR